MVYSIFAEDAVFEEKFAKQNGLFEEILHTILSISYYGIQWLPNEKVLLKKPPLLAASFKFMTQIDLFVVQFIFNH